MPSPTPSGAPEPGAYSPTTFLPLEAVHPLSIAGVSASAAASSWR